MEATVLKRNFLSMQVCVPKEFTDEQVLMFAEQEFPCGTTNGWQIRRQGSESISGCDERTQCDSHEENCHIMLDA